MYEISVQTHFSAAHHLRGHAGACANLHGHNWDVRVTLGGHTTDELGMLVDFGLVKARTAEVMRELDHQDLNRLPVFAERNPTSENIARYLFERLAFVLNTDRCCVVRVQVSETPGTMASYEESPV